MSCRWMMRSVVAMLALIVLGSAVAKLADPYIWLEQVDGKRAMSWVHAENRKTLAVLEKDPRYAGLYSDALAIAEAKDRIPAPSSLDGSIFNFWQDSEHVRGILRRTSLESYRTAAPQWTTVLDLDALATAEKANWFLKDNTCVEPGEQHCMLSLSDGGEDAVTVREFDVKAARFAENGFSLSRGKQRVAWEDDNTLLVSREWAPGELTTSGYPFIVKRVTRGQPLSAARELFRGTASDGGYGVSPQVLTDGAGHKAVIITRPVTTFEFESYLVSGDRVLRLNVPKKVDIQSLVAGQLIMSLAEDWTAAGKTFAQGSLVAFDLGAALQDPEHLKPTLLYAPGPRESLEATGATSDALIVTTLDNVRGRGYIYRPQADGSWRKVRLDLPDNATVGIADADLHSHNAFLSVAGFLQPSSLWLLDTAGDKPVLVKTLPPKFDASHDVVEQFEASSSDATRVPYFIVHPKQMKLDGGNPTILTAYGGFQVSLTPFYSANIGKLWLEKGGVFVLANIRGGGEFGPAWHEAGLKTHRQRIYDDFTAVARDLIGRGITSPRRLGIEGGSNGGLLMGVQFTQHPELWNAVDIQVPLLDMVRFEKIAAGTSWVGEYGSVSNPEEAAFLEKISPYANIRRGLRYPEPFIWTTTKDDRVGPQHARKFAARLAEYRIPYLYYEVTEGGHGSGANLREKAHTGALEMTYFARKLMD
ncbi:MAG TPA: prolyl oligopeptidase family serine peptidase [Steroidobacteraceae bacterium]|nr:prolyl oligopeptidase family serine peptidase [Steroidobacteraceae bacterium]